MKLSAVEKQIIDDMVARAPRLKDNVDSLLEIHSVLVNTYDNNGKILTCGNGGSAADAIHIVGELVKSFERLRPVSDDMVENLKDLPFGQELSENLETGLAAIALGNSTALKTAVENDNDLRDIAFAQETFALIKPEDTLIGISTSGNANNVLMAMSVAKAKGAATVSFTGRTGGKMNELADAGIVAPGTSTKEIQENHLVLYHTMCALIEAHYFPKMR